MFDQYLKKHLEYIKQHVTSGLIIYKGFPATFLNKISNTIPFLNDIGQFDKDNKIQLDKILSNKKKLIQNIMSVDSTSILTFEEFTVICRGLSPEMLDFEINIINNDLFREWYPNPSNYNFPDQLYDIENDNKFNPDKVFEHFYTSSKIIKEQNLICYPDLITSDFPSIREINFFEGIIEEQNIEYLTYNGNNDSIIELPSPDDKFTLVKTDFYFNNLQEKYEFLISKESHHIGEDKIREELRILNSISNELTIEFNVYIKEEKETKETRSEYNHILEKYWGSNSFRKLLFYKNPGMTNEKKEISQDQIVEYLVRQSEIACEGKRYQDIFITAPTGSGKSLLFQIPAIYLSEHNDLVSIVVSPLKALMYDQVASLNERGVTSACFINSDISFIKRQDIIEGLKNGDKSILYLSPELLLSYSISEFIGERKIGLLIIDEAHLVSTWGRDFRVDYWYLGKYIRNIRKYSQQNFPIVALTATAVYGGDNDIVFETVESLNMMLPKLFIGNVRRDEIKFDIRDFQYFGNHEDEKVRKTTKKIEANISSKIKTICYFPWTKQIEAVYLNIIENLRDMAGRYYGRIDKYERKDVIDKFKDNNLKCVLATKAFGMGVDIGDILEIYHHAPSGNLSDYVQEIGRVARQKDLEGKAVVDFSKKDLKFTKILYGLSSVKQYQVKLVIEKINNFYQNKKKQNLLFSIEDFQYIFPNTDNCDAKVKSALLLLENDLHSKYGYYVVLVRPKSLYSTVFAEIPNETEKDFLSKYGRFCKKITKPPLNKDIRMQIGDLIINHPNSMNNFYIIELDKIWEKYFSNESFPNVKWRFFSRKLFSDVEKENPKALYKLEITLKKNVPEALEQLSYYWEILCVAFQYLTGHYFTSKEFEKTISHRITDKILRKRISDLILTIYSTRVKPEFGPNRLTNPESFLQMKTENNIPKYRVMNTKYFSYSKQIKRKFSEMFYLGNHFVQFISPSSPKTKCYIELAQQIESFKIGTYEFSGGIEPRIFIRINDPYKIRLISNDENYENSILKDINKRHDVSMKIMEYFFTQNLSDNERWNFIEDYFLGKDDKDIINH